MWGAGGGNPRVRTMHRTTAAYEQPLVVGGGHVADHAANEDTCVGGDTNT